MPIVRSENEFSAASTGEQKIKKTSNADRFNIHILLGDKMYVIPYVHIMPVKNVLKMEVIIQKRKSNEQTDDPIYSVRREYSKKSNGIIFLYITACRTAYTFERLPQAHRGRKSKEIPPTVDDPGFSRNQEFVTATITFVHIHKTPADGVISFSRRLSISPASSAPAPSSSAHNPATRP